MYIHVKLREGEREFEHNTSCIIHIQVARGIDRDLYHTYIHKESRQQSVVDWLSSTYSPSSPRKMTLSFAPEAIMSSEGWKATEFTQPLWPGSL